MKLPDQVKLLLLLALVVSTVSASAMVGVLVFRPIIVTVLHHTTQAGSKTFSLPPFPFLPAKQPVNFDDLISQARTDFYNGQYERASNECGQVIASAPAGLTSAPAYYWRGRCKRHLGQIPQALQDLGSAVSLDPKYNAAFYERGLIYIDCLNDLDHAFSDFSNCVALDPTGAIGSSSYNCLGRVYLQRGDFDKAISIFKQAIALDPTSDWPYNNLAMIYFAQGKYAQALPYEDQAVKCDPQSGHHRFKRGLMYKQLGKKEQAESEFAEARRLGFDVEGTTVDVPNVKGRILNVH